jgi:RNA polymerase sigma-70 factor (ECF subfamily)
MIKTIPELVEDFVNGNPSAFGELVKRYQRNIYFLAYRLLGNHLDADEVVQETFVRIYKRKEEIANVGNFTSFLTRVATNYAIDLLRKRRGHGGVTDDPSSLPGEIQIELSKKVRTPEDLFRNKVLLTEISASLQKLPTRQRITVILHDVEGYTKSEVAAIMECPEATVRSNLHIARIKLRKMLKKRLSI